MDDKMEEIKLVIPGQPIPKKNSMRILHTPQGRPFVAPSKRFEEYQKHALQYIPKEARIKIDQPCNVQCRYFRGTRHRVDLINLLQATDDILVAAGVLADDCYSVVSAHDNCRVFYNKKEPRTEIIITPLDGPPVP